MPGQIVIRSSSPMPLNRQKTFPSATPPPPPNQTPNLTPTSAKSTPNVGEVAGGTAAGIFVVCCCCPCGLVKVLIKASYKVPATVGRLIWKTQRHKLMMGKNKKKKCKTRGSLEQGGYGGVGGVHFVGYSDELSDVDLKEFEKVKISIDGSAEAIELDRQMWDQFRDAGFWRSPSQRELA